MSARTITRRSLLATGAGAVASGLVRPHGVFAALTSRAITRGDRTGRPVPPPVLGEHWVGRLPAGDATTVELHASADLVGVQWEGGPAVGLQMRVRDGAGRWSRWVSAGSHGHGPDGDAAAHTMAAAIGEPIWTGGTRAVQLCAKRALSGVRLRLVDVSGGLGARRLAELAEMRSPIAFTAALPLAEGGADSALAAGAGQPSIIARRAWAQGVSPPRVAPAYGVVRLAFVHHTENPNGYSAGEVPAMLRAIYAFHRYVRGWNDIGYNFVVDLFGRIFESRAGGIDEPVVGAQAGGYNLVSTGVAVLGSFMEVPISTPARSALERLLAWKLSLHGAPSLGAVTVRVNPAGASYSRFPANAHVPLPRIAGHRDGDSTDCPGNVLYGELPSIRSGVHRLAALPTQAALTLAPETQTLGGSLRLLDGTPLTGAHVLVQARSVKHRGEAVSEVTVAEAITNATGEWSLPANAAVVAATGSGAWLRVLYTGAAGAPGASVAAGAAVSDPLHVSLQALTSPPSTTSPAGTTPPAGSTPAGTTPTTPSQAPAPTSSASWSPAR